MPGLAIGSTNFCGVVPSGGVIGFAAMADFGGAEVWLMRATGDSGVSFDQPDSESFGAGVGAVGVAGIGGSVDAMGIGRTGAGDAVAGAGPMSWMIFGPAVKPPDKG